MFEFVARAFDTTGFVPRKNCGEWTPALVWMHIGGDLFIWLAYLSIPLVLLYFTRRRDLPYPKLFVLFAVFILACGFGHLIEALMFDHPLYRLAAVWKVFTAIVSWVTVLALIPAIPRVMQAVSWSGGNAPPGSGTPPGGFGNTTLHRLAAPTSRDRVGDYIVAILAGVLALLVRAAIDEIVATDHVYVLSLLAVVFVSWQSGFGPGIVTLLVSMVGMVYFFIVPRGSFVVEGFGNQLATGMFFFCGVCCAGLGEAQWVARKRAKQALAAALEQKDELTAEVARRQTAEAGLRASEGTLRAFYNNSPVCMGIVELLADDVRHVYDNGASCEFFGVAPEATAGRRASELGIPPPVLSLWREMYAESAAKDAAVPFEYEYDSPKGRRWLRATVSPLDPDAEGRRLFCYVSEDVTTRRRAEEAVRESEQRWRLALDAAELGAWNIDPATNTLTSDERFQLIFSGKRGPISYEQAFDLVHPDDRQAVRDAVAAATRPERPAPYSIEYRVVHPDGAVRWISAKGRANFRPGPSGSRLASFDGTVADIQEQKRAADELAERGRIASLRAELAEALSSDGLKPALQGCVETLVAHLGAAFARVWTTDSTGEWLELLVSAGTYTHTNGDHARIRFGEYKVGRIAATGRPQLTNDVPHDPNVSDPAWAAREGIVAFAGYPLIVEGRVLGVLALFAKEPFSDYLAAELAPIAENVAQYLERRRAEDAVRESEARFRSMADSVPALIWLAERDEQRTYFNRGWLEFTGRAVADELGYGWADGIHPDDRDRYLGGYTTAFASREGFEIEYRLRRRDGAYRWMLARGTPRFAPAGGFAGFVGLCLDVTDRRDAELAVRESEERFRTLTEAIPQIVWNADPAGNVTYVSSRWVEYTGGSREKPLGTGWLDAAHPEDRDRALAAWRDTIDAATIGTADRFSHELRLRHGATGDYRWFLAVAVPLRRPDGSIDQWIGSMADVHDQKTASAAVAESEEKFRTLTEAMPQFVWTCRADGWCDYLSRQWVEYTGTPEADQLGAKWLAQVHPDDRDRLAAKWRETIATEANLDVEFRIRRHDGVYRWFKTRAVPFRNPAGAILKWVGTNTDIDDTKQAEAGVRAAMERFRTLTEAVPQMVWTADPKGEVNFFNRRWDEYTGVPLSAGRIDGFGDIVHPEDAEQLRAEWQLATAHQADRFAQEFRLRRAGDGAYRWMLSNAVSLRDPAGNVAEWVGSITDIDDQKRYAETLEQTVQERTADLQRMVEERTAAEAEVRKQREFLDAILANINNGIVACDATGTLTMFNRAAMEFHGLPAEPVPSDEWAASYDLYRPDGVTPLPPEELPLLMALRGARVRDVEMVIAPRGGSPRTLLASGQQLTDAEGNNLGAVVSMRDVTEQREADRQLREAAAELRRANAELGRSNGELEQFAYVASHDLQEPLRKIQAFGDRLVTRVRAELPEAGREYVDRMLTSAGRMRRLIDDLLTFSRVTTQAKPFSRIDLGKIAREVVIDLSERIEPVGGDVRIGDLPAIDADPTQMRQLFQNLIANAVKFQRRDVPPVVQVTAEVLPELPGSTESSGPVCRLTVQDNGIGFDEKYKDRIFQVFQRLHGREEYEGTGVGLAICRKIVERHGGTITARSRPGEGTAFIITLPIHHSQPTGPPADEF